MIDFIVNRDRCTRCGNCVNDCPSRIIIMGSGDYPAIAPEREAACLCCEHCMAICPTAAIAILGFTPDESMVLAGSYPEAWRLEALVRGRRSVRRYRQQNLDPSVIDKLIEVAACAPTGMNSRQVRFTLLDDRMKVARLRDEVMDGLATLEKSGALPSSKGYFSRFIRIWEKHRVDLVFRDAPHMLITTAPRSLSTSKEDCMIALATFELYAQAQGIGTLWNGMATWAIDQLLPEFRLRLGIPEDHLFGYAMLFGKPAIQYQRTVQHPAPQIYRVS